MFVLTLSLGLGEWHGEKEADLYVNRRVKRLAQLSCDIKRAILDDIGADFAAYRVFSSH